MIVIILLIVFYNKTSIKYLCSRPALIRQLGPYCPEIPPGLLFFQPITFTSIFFIPLVLFDGFLEVLY